MKRWAPLVPLLVLAYLCWRFTVDVPFCDDWQMVDDLGLLARGGYPMARLWRFQNEHRFAFSMPILLLLAKWTRWRIGAEVALNVALAAAAFAVVRRNVAGWTALAVAVVMFSWVQWENWTWGYQLSVFLQLLAGVGMVALLPRRWPAAAALAFVAQFTFGFGQAAWPTGMWMLARQRRWGALAAWAAMGAAATALYFTGWSIIVPVQHARGLAQVPSFVLLFLGRPLAHGWPAALVALSGLVLAAALLHRRPAPSEASRFGWGLVMYALFAGAACALGRAADMQAALISRYTTVAQLFWVGLIVVMGSLPADEWRRLRFVPIGIAAASLLAGIADLPAWRAHAQALAAARPALAREDWADPSLAALQPTDRQRFHEWTENLRALRLS
ncbi:MAG TPA: hypothetical protein VFE12_16685, partial [Acetobacteraceae bacterium]|nr:hypothetical protein [Acetobacteraceae bacterium]